MFWLFFLTLSAVAIALAFTFGRGYYATSMTRSTAADNIISSISDGFLLVSPEGKVMDANAAFESLCGIRRDKILGADASRFFADRDDYDRIADAVSRGAPLPLFTTMLVLPDCERAETQVSCSPIRDSAGAVTACAMIFRDAAERRAAEEKIRATARAHEIMAATAVMYVGLKGSDDIYRIISDRLSILADDSPVFVSIYNPDRRALTPCAKSAFPSVFEFILGFAPGEFRKTEFPVSRDVYDKLLEGRLIELRGGVEELFQGKLSRAEAQKIESLLSIDKVYVAGISYSGRLLGLAALAPRRGVSVEIPAVEAFVAQASVALTHHEALNLLKKNEERFRLLAENAADIIYRVRLSPEMAFEYVSPSVEKITGYSPEEYYKNPNLGFEMVYPDDRPALAGLGDGKDFLRSAQTRWLTKSGKIIWVEQKNVPIYDDAGRLVAIEGISRDITERVLAEKEKENLNAQLVRSGHIASVGELAAGLAHEIGNSLQTIIGNAEIIRHTESGEEVDSILSAARHAGTIIENLLGFARQSEMCFVPASIGDIVDKTLSLYGKQLKLSGIRIEKKFASLPPVLASPSHLSQVFINIIANARKAMSHGGTLIIETRLERNPPLFAENLSSDESASRDYAAVIFGDTGDGIDPAQIGRLFEPFFSMRKGGTGLGLSVSYGIIKQHGGRITAYSAGLGKGAEFKILLPLEASSANTGA